MNALRLIPAFGFALALAAAPAIAGESTATAAAPHAGFDLMKSLAGTWEMKAEDGKVTTLTYTVVSDGTALMETMDTPGTHAAMVTMYHPDGADLMLTHYCGAGNQPRMRCAKPAKVARSLAFEFMDAANMPTPATGHMHHLVVTLVDADHVTQEWTWKKGDEEGKELFTFERKRS
jgi:hypothetical protein